MQTHIDSSSGIQTHGPNFRVVKTHAVSRFECLLFLNNEFNVPSLISCSDRKNAQLWDKHQQYLVHLTQTIG
jgi:hypothetical protein